MASTANSIVHCKVGTKMFVETFDELIVVVCSIITHKVIEFVIDIVAAKNVGNLFGLRKARMIAKEVSETNDKVALDKFGIWMLTQ